MAAKKRCWYQTRIPNAETYFKQAIETETYWTVQEQRPDTMLEDATYYLLRFESLRERKIFHKEYSSKHVYGTNTFAVQMSPWTNVPRICLTKIPPLMERYSSPRKKLTYKQAAEDLIRVMKGRRYLVDEHAWRDAATELDYSRIKHGY